MLKPLLFIGCVLSAALAVYCFNVSKAAQTIVTAANGPSALHVPIDFSKPFTNEFKFRHTAQPWYGTTYLRLKANPWPESWKDSETAAEDLKAAKGQLCIYSTNNALVQALDLDWFYWRSFRFEPRTFPLQQFFTRLPLGDYRLVILTTAPVPQLSGAKQELIVRYDYIHEASIANALQFFGFLFVVTASASGAAFLWKVKRRANR